MVKTFPVSHQIQKKEGCNSRSTGLCRENQIETLDFMLHVSESQVLCVWVHVCKQPRHHSAQCRQKILDQSRCYCFTVHLSQLKILLSCGNTTPQRFRGGVYENSLKLQCLHYNLLCEEGHSNLWHTGLQFKKAVFEPMFRVSVLCSWPVETLRSTSFQLHFLQVYMQVLS